MMILIVLVIQHQVDSGTLVPGHLGLDGAVRSLGVTVMEVTDEDEVRRVRRVRVREQLEASVGKVVTATCRDFSRHLLSLVVLVHCGEDGVDANPRLEELESPRAGDSHRDRVVLSH